MVVSVSQANNTLVFGTPKELFQTAVAEAGSNTTHFTCSPDGQRFLLPTGESETSARKTFVITEWRPRPEVFP